MAEATAPLDAGGGPGGPADLVGQVSRQLTRGLARLAQSARLPAGGRPPRPVLVAVAHGSRDPRAVTTVRALLERVRALRPDLDVRLGHIELNEPLLSGTLDALATLTDRQHPTAHAVLVPLLLSRGHHVKHDLPAALAAAPHVRGAVAGSLGPHPLLAEALHTRLTEAGWDRPGSGSAGGPGKAVVLAAAGSRDPDAAVDTARTAALLSARLGGVPVVPAFASVAAPTVAEAVAALTVRGLRRVAVAACFTAPGRFATQTAAAAPWIAAAPLGAQDAMARLVVHRYEQAAAGLAAGWQGPLAAATPR
ncbi:sirohydrochlorin chelatase [Actinacidiphila acidipaludis]|uniref:Sirohydrochlorin chelatase n=1 Tax=Actinacidiphila acidipaludis TaxID=2873382 RepID=A0ABS7Q3M0_9ACTN|nr:CbiX/SirB N-terminal domain-containing protein [Streptomyces acidipaludis]MBY8877750.1 sirohydrochlorin chelatase [Streptomyces acidipaludis]